MSVKRAVKILRRTTRILVFTGAGISTESGIPDFRGPDGLWKRNDPADFSLGAFLENPAARHRYWTMMRGELNRASGLEFRDISSTAWNPNAGAIDW